MWNEYFRDKVVVIGGGAMGIGAASSEGFARAEAITYITDVADSVGEELADRLRGEGLRVHFRHCDVSSEREVESVFDEISATAGVPDVVHANAAIEWVKDVRHTTFEEWHRVLSVNLDGLFLFGRRALLGMCERGSGAIVVTSSPHATATVPDAGAYAASKGAAHALVHAMALEGAAYDVRVNGIVPGTIDTPMVRREAQAAKDPALQLQRMAATHPLGRLGQSEEVANVALFLASPLASFVTGALYAVDGGLMAGLPSGPPLKYNNDELT